MSYASKPAFNFYDTVRFPAESDDGHGLIIGYSHTNAGEIVYSVLSTADDRLYMDIPENQIELEAAMPNSSPRKIGVRHCPNGHPIGFGCFENVCNAEAQE